MDALADMQTQEQGKRLSEHNEREEEEQLQTYWAWVYVASMAIIWRRFISLFFKFAFQNTIVSLMHFRNLGALRARVQLASAVCEQ